MMNLILLLKNQYNRKIKCNVQRHTHRETEDVFKEIEIVPCG